MASPKTHRYNAEMKRKILQSVCGMLAAFFSAAPVCAQDVSPWISEQGSQLRLIAGSRGNGSAPLLGGIEIVLKPGWKTYWRTPGDSGIPPRFDFSGSKNVAKVDVLWPAPEAFPDGAGGTSYGYHDAVIFPLRIIPEDGGKPVTLVASIDYAVCNKICVPAHAAAELSMSADASGQDERLAHALQLLPKPADIGSGAPPLIRKVRRDEATHRVVVDIDNQGQIPLTLFAEGPSPDWALPVPERLKAPSEPSAGTTEQFAFALDGAPPNTPYAGAALRLTLRGGDASYEYVVTLN